MAGFAYFDVDKASIVALESGRGWSSVVPGCDAEVLGDFFADKDELWEVFGDYFDQLRRDRDWLDVTFDVHICPDTERVWAEFTPLT